MSKRKEEYHFYKNLGICVRCHKNSAEPKKVFCLECAVSDNERCRTSRQRNLAKAKERDNDKYRKLKANGICTYCKHEKAIQGKTKCAKCLAKIRAKRQLKATGLPRAEWTSYGLCYLCGKNPILEDKKVCAGCYKQRMESIGRIMHLPAKGYWKQLNDGMHAKRN